MSQNISYKIISPMGHFRSLKFGLIARRNESTLSFSFFCLCPVSLAAELNFNKLKVVYCVNIIFFHYIASSVSGQD